MAAVPPLRFPLARRVKLATEISHQNNLGSTQTHRSPPAFASLPRFWDLQAWTTTLTVIQPSQFLFSHSKKEKQIKALSGHKRGTKVIWE